MTGRLADMALDKAADRVPLQDAVRWVDAIDQLEGGMGEQKAGLLEALSHIEAEIGLFVLADSEGAPVSAVRCVRDRELAGIFDLVTRADQRGQGHGGAVLASALKWALGRGAAKAWLQVVADNAAATALYRRFGFEEFYRYFYLGAPQ